MTTYNAPLKDMQFVLNDVLQLSKYSNLPSFSEASEDVIEAILEEGAEEGRDRRHSGRDAARVGEVDAI